MLLAIGLQPDAVLAGPSIRFNQAVPSPPSFNHLITRVSVDGKEVWLDSTSEVAGYSVLLTQVRDRDVLVVPQSGSSTIAHTPTDLPFKQDSTFKVVGSLNGVLASDSTITIMHHDDAEVFLRAVLRQTSPSNYERLVQQLMANYGFGGKVSDVQIEHVSDSSQALTIQFHYHRDRSEDWGENRVTAAFGPTMMPAIDKTDLPRWPLDLGAPRTDTSTLEIELPQGWNMELPEAVHRSSPRANCDVTYQLKDGSLIAERRVTVLQAKIPVAELKSYADWYEACGAGSVPYLQLTKVSATGVGTSLSSSAQTKALRLVYRANNELRGGKYDQAETDLKQAQELDVTARDLWGDLGAVAMHRGDQVEAMRLYAKETDLHPESEFAYRNLARIQSLTGAEAAALDTLLRWQKRAPANPVPSIQAVQMLLNQLDNAGALKQARASEGLLTDNAQKEESFRLILGEAEMRGGEIDAGEQLMRTIAMDSTDQSHRNDASYELAMVGRDLSLAEQAEHTVLEQLAAESRSWTGAEAPEILRGKSSLITACWDTMGWILFKQGKVEEAEAWIRPTFAMRASALIGEHLGDVLMAEKKPADAVTAYAEALATLPVTDAMGVRIKIDPPRAKELRTKLDSAKAAAKMTQVPDGHPALQGMRVWKIGAANGLNGTAEFRTLLSSRGVVSALPTGEVPHSMQERILAANWRDRYPPGEDLWLAAKVMLNCHGDICEVVLEP
jgi:tetratricopeptide (TPR) repeat protein